MTMSVEEAKDLIMKMHLGSKISMYEKTTSPTVILDKSIEHKGIKTDYKFAHTYKLPNNVDYDTFIRRHNERILYCLIKNDVIKEFKNAKAGTLLHKVKQSFIEDFPAIHEEIMQEIKTLKELNPELEPIDTVISPNAIIYGVSTMSSPEEIEWRINEANSAKPTNRNSDIEFSQQMSLIGIKCAGAIYSPKSKEKLLEIIKDYQRDCLNLINGKI